MNLLEGVKEIICIVVVVAFRAEREAKVGSIGGDNGIGGISQISGVSSLRTWRSKSPTSRRRSWNGRSRSKGRSVNFIGEALLHLLFSTSSSSSSDDHVFLTPSSRHHHGSPSLDWRHERKWSYVDVKSLAYWPSFGGRNIEHEDVIFFVSIVEDLFTSRYTDKSKIKAAVIILKNKCLVWHVKERFWELEFRSY